jgi:hypothetical protein
MIAYIFSAYIIAGIVLLVLLISSVMRFNKQKKILKKRVY